jgi:hypothetical protein
MKNLDLFLESDSFSSLDRHFAGFIQKLSGASSPELVLAAALVSHVTRKATSASILHWSSPWISMKSGNDLLCLKRVSGRKSSGRAMWSGNRASTGP